MKKIQIAVLFIMVLVFCVYAGEPFTGGDIARNSFYRDDGSDSCSQVEMTLIDKNGNERKRILDMYGKDYGELQKNFVRFLSPAEIEGTGFLSWENEEEDDTQYLYLPDLRRPRRIVSSQKDLRFVNTDFTYEDMQRRKLNLDKHELLREEQWNGHMCYVVAYIPKNSASSQYSKVVHWFEKVSFVPVKVECYNKKGELFKRLTVSKLEKVDGIWTVMDVLMDDTSENHKTRMRMIEVHYNQELGDELFTLENLQDY